jgi:hypothetical protein
MRTGWSSQAAACSRCGCRRRPSRPRSRCSHRCGSAAATALLLLLLLLLLLCRPAGLMLATLAVRPSEVDRRDRRRPGRRVMGEGVRPALPVAAFAARPRRLSLAAAAGWEPARGSGGGHPLGFGGASAAGSGDQAASAIGCAAVGAASPAVRRSPSPSRRVCGAWQGTTNRSLIGRENDVARERESSEDERGGLA